MTRTLAEDAEIVLQAVTEVYGVTREMVLGLSQKRDSAGARLAAYYVLTQHRGRSLSDVGRTLGRNHSTIHWGIGKVIRRIAADQDEANRIQAVLLRCGALTTEMQQLALQSIAYREVVSMRERVEAIEAQAAAMRREVEIMERRFARLSAPVITRGVA